jgi:2-polyprenyl-3-methyl-5-hydroxy-6-metoxy-1,4-benzoquinol methylase
MSNDLSRIYDNCYRDGYRDTLSGYEIARWEALSNFIQKRVDLSDGSAVLDYGCGRGLHISLWQSLFPAAELFFCDISSVALDMLRKGHPAFAGNCALVENNKAQFASGSFDIIVSVEVMEHVEDLCDYLHDIRRLLKSNGIFVWTTPCANALSIEHIYSALTNQIEQTDEGFRRWRWEDSPHIRRLKTKELRTILTDMGFCNIIFRFRSHLFSFLCTKLCKGPLQEFGERIMTLDYSLFRSLPNGASMLGYARKMP